MKLLGAVINQLDDVRENLESARENAISLGFSESRAQPILNGIESAMEGLAEILGASSE